jgi:hypothetical protein
MIDHLVSNNTNVSIDVHGSSNNIDKICSRSTDNSTRIDEQIEPLLSSMINEHLLATTKAVTVNDRMSRRERKLQERWTVTTKTDTHNQEQVPTKTYLGVEFPPIAAATQILKFNIDIIVNCDANNKSKERNLFITNKNIK